QVRDHRFGDSAASRATFIGDHQIAAFIGVPPDRLEWQRVEPTYVDHARRYAELVFQPARGAKRQSQSISITDDQQVFRLGSVDAPFAGQQHLSRLRIIEKPRAVAVLE